jgi:hypothetical protein
MESHSIGHAEPQFVIAAPVYRVQFWEQPALGYGYNLDAFVLIGAIDVHEALEWVQGKARGRIWELFLEATLEPEPVEVGLQVRRAPLVRLAGRNPTESTGLEVSLTG